MSAAVPTRGTISSDYRARARTPDDFDAFWTGVLPQAAAVALAPEIAPDPLRTSGDVEVFHASYTSVARAFAPRVRAAALLLAGAPGAVPDASALEPVATALGGPATVHVSERSTYRDGLHVERWIAEPHGIEDVESILPEHWR